MKKGFTLIELLAVIVILAIIALIATPIVLDIINDSKESATLRSADFYLDGLEKSIATSTLKNMQIQDGTYSIMSNGDICIGEYDKANDKCTIDPLKVEIDGEKPNRGTVTIINGQIKKIDMTISSNEVWTNPFTDKLEYKLAPGLYDENDNLIVSWEELEDEYKLDLEKTNYQKNASNIIEQFTNATKLVISSEVETIGDYAFRACDNLIEIIIPNSVKTITQRAFYGCTNLKSILIPESVTSIEYRTFYLCTSLTNVIIPNSITNIASEAFLNCTNLTNITIPNSAVNISNDVFSGCTSLTKIDYNGTATGYPWGAPNLN